MRCIISNYQISNKAKALYLSWLKKRNNSTFNLGNKTLKIIKANEIVSVDLEEFKSRLLAYRRVHCDLGSGDGKFLYQMARSTPDTYFIAVDINPYPMAAMAIKANKKPIKGGANNIGFIISSVENLPTSLCKIADTITINYAWNSLLRYVLTPEESVLNIISNLGKSGSSLDILVNFSVFKDSALCEKLKLPIVNESYVKKTLIPSYAKSGIYIKNYLITDKGILNTTWGKKITLGSGRRETLKIHAAIRHFSCRSSVHLLSSTAERKTLISTKNYYFLLISHEQSSARLYNLTLKKNFSFERIMISEKICCHRSPETTQFDSQLDHRRNKINRSSGFMFFRNRVENKHPSTASHLDLRMKTNSWPYLVYPSECLFRQNHYKCIAKPMMNIKSSRFYFRSFQGYPSF